MRRATEWFVLGVVVVASMWLWSTPGSPDVGIWTEWLTTAMRLGLRGGYAATAHDYPPGSTTLLWIAGHLGVAMGSSTHDVLKALVATFLCATTAVVLAWTRKPLVAALGHASLAVGAIGLVYLDILAAPLLIGAVWALARERRGLALALLTVACAIKWQPIMVMPFVACYACLARPAGRTIWQALARFGLVVGGIGAVLLVVFGPVVLSAFYSATGHKHLSAQAANVGWVLTWILHVANPAVFGPIEQGRSLVIVPHHSVLVPLEKVLFATAYLTLLVRYARSGDRSVPALVRHALAGYLVYFLFNSGVHENHLQMAAIFAVALVAIDTRWIWLAIALAICANANLMAFYGIDGPFRYHVFFGVDASVWVAVATVAIVAVAVVRLVPLSSSPPRAA